MGIKVLWKLGSVEFLPLAFFVTAILYASVGFGGGSTYNALLVLAGVDFAILPLVALICNIIVVSGSVIRLRRAGHIDIARIWPFLAASIPLAWLGGRLEISQTVFIGVLGGALLLAGIRMLWPEHGSVPHPPQTPPLWAFGIGGAIGFLSGLVAIGGGIFLAPVLYLIKWDGPRKIAGAAALFILANSLAGLWGQISKIQASDDLQIYSSLAPFIPHFIAVFLGGQIGSYLVSGPLPKHRIRQGAAVLILFVAARLLWRWITVMLGG